MVHRSTNVVLGVIAPPSDLKLPERLVITATEIVVYLPNHIRNYDVLLRLIQGGITQMAIANLVNLHRLLPIGKFPLFSNTISKIMQKEMRVHSGYNDWTMGKHKTGCYDYDYHWDQEDLSLNYTRVNCELDPEHDELREVVNPPTSGIPFADLAINVNTHPSYARGDGFIFTRCIQYAALHPEEEYIFPRDFAYLAEKLDDGRQILPQHSIGPRRHVG